MTRGVYRALLRVLPESFRQEYGEEMDRVAAEHWQAIRDRRGRFGAALFWTRQCAALLREATRLRGRGAARGAPVTLDGFGQDLRHATRGLVHRPGFAFVTIVTLGLGIGATTAIFSAVRTVLLRPLPYAEPSRVVTVFQRDAVSEVRAEGVSAANIRDYADAARVLSSVAVAEPWSLDMQIGERAEVLRTWAVSAGFFEAVGAGATLGRTFLDEEYLEGNAQVVVLRHATWVTRFGADPSLVGRAIQLDGEPVTVVGIMPSEFRFPDAADAWIPRPPRAWDEQSRAAAFMSGVARLAPGASLEQARAEADAIAASLQRSHPQVNGQLAFDLVPLREHLFGNVRAPLFVLLAAVGVVLLIACANVAGLMLARGAQREREYALRGALGAGVGRLVSHVTAESLVLAAAGCALGVGLTYAGVSVIQAMGPDHLPRIDEMRVDGLVLGFAVLAGGVSAVLSGLAPSLRFSRPELREVLSDGSRGSTAGASGSRLRARLVAVEIASAVVLLVGAGLLVRSFTVLMDKELGFDPRGRVALQIFAYDGYADVGDEGPTRAVFVERVLEEMEAIPGVSAAGVTTNLPGATDGAIASIEIDVPFTIVDRAAPPPGQEPIVFVSQVTPRYFEVMGIDLVEGRAFTAADDPDGVPVVVVNEAFVRRHFGDRDVLGERLVLGRRQPVPREIVGVVRDTRPLGHASAPKAEVFLPLRQVSAGSLTFVLRGETDASSLVQPASEAIWSVNPAQAVWGAATVEALLSDWMKERRFNLFLLSTFSVIALALAAVGIYGLISFSVQRRIGELGVRRALGGQAGDLLRMVLGEGIRLTGLGIAAGLAGAWYLSRFMRGMLFEVEPTDPATFVTLSVVVLVVATIATLVPALRAMRVDPVVALRSE